MSVSKLRFAAPVFMAVVAMAATSACSAAKEAEAQGDCSATLEGKAFVQAEGDMEAVAKSIKIAVATSCRNIAVAGTMTTMWDGQSEPTDDQVTDACNVAVSVIGAAKAAASGMFSLEIDGEAKCEADVSAQGSCTAECSGNAQCMADVTASCDPGQLSVSCSGMCSAGATCEGSPDVAVMCTGSCSGECSGTVTGGCEGTCNGMCDGMASDGKTEGACKGKCEGTCSKPAASATCNGQCKASCKLMSDLMCSGSAKCTGGCKGTATAPTCKGEVKASCMASASCNGSCQAHAQATAHCTPPKVHLVAGGMIDAKLITAIETEIPNLLMVATVQGKAIVNVAGSVVGGIQGALSGSAACALKLKGFVEASASVNVSVMASASASGSASGGT